MPKTTPPPPIKLPEEVAQNLRDQEAVVVRARKSIQALKKLGLETKALEDKLEWAEKARTTLLSEFS